MKNRLTFLRVTSFAIVWVLSMAGLALANSQEIVGDQDVKEPQVETMKSSLQCEAPQVEEPGRSTSLEVPLDIELTNRTCTSTATCQTGTVSCTGQSLCTAGVDSSCPGTRGYAQCDGTKYYCPACQELSCSQQGWECGVTNRNCGGICTCVIVENGCGYCPC